MVEAGRERWKEVLRVPQDREHARRLWEDSRRSSFDRKALQGNIKVSSFAARISFAKHSLTCPLASLPHDKERRPASEAFWSRQSRARRGNPSSNKSRRMRQKRNTKTNSSTSKSPRLPQTYHFNEVSIPQPIPSRYLPSSQPIASLYELASFNSAFFLAFAPRSFVA